MIFTIALIALSAKMARADGMVSDAEIEAFKRIVRVPPEEEGNVRRIFNLAHQNIAGYEAYAGQIAQLYAGLVRNPVSRLERLDEYDPSGAIGFCYGRAMSAQLMASRLGLETKSIRKLFIVGDLRSNPAKRDWRFHVTTIVRNDRGEWIALDLPIQR